MYNLHICCSLTLVILFMLHHTLHMMIITVVVLGTIISLFEHCFTDVKHNTLHHRNYACCLCYESVLVDSMRILQGCFTGTAGTVIWLPQWQWNNAETMGHVPRIYWGWYNLNKTRHNKTIPDSEVHVANMGPTWVLSAPGGPHVEPINLAIWDMHDLRCDTAHTKCVVW